MEEPRPIDFSTERLAVIDLESQIGALDGHALRLSRTSVAPGGRYDAHSHDGKPEVIYVLTGTLTDTRDGAVTNHGPGSVLQMTNGTIHALANHGTVPVTYLSVTVKVP